MAAEASLEKPFSKEHVFAELQNIATWWASIPLDHKNGGFVGEVTYNGRPVVESNKGVILNSRILWFFSEIALFTPTETYNDMAKRAFDWISEFLHDKEYGGMYWEVSAIGRLTNGKKQTYAQCFCIYALSRYYALTEDSKALQLAMECFELVEAKARDREYGGYIEACTQTWGAVTDFRLSDKDLNCPKSMNTHLHVLEAYAALYRVSPTNVVKEALSHVIQVFLENIVTADRKHLTLFFDATWNPISDAVSFGHDIEASWLLHEAVTILNEPAIAAEAEPVILGLAESCLNKGIAPQGYVCDEYLPAPNHRNEVSFWWVQAEALVGFLNAYTLTQNEEFLIACNPIWAFIQRHHIDYDHGEWHWRANCHDLSGIKEYKAGFWKAPYHNGRAMMELCRLFNQIGY